MQASKVYNQCLSAYGTWLFGTRKLRIMVL